MVCNLGTFECIKGRVVKSEWGWLWSFFGVHKWLQSSYKFHIKREISINRTFYVCYAKILLIECCCSYYQFFWFFAHFRMFLYPLSIESEEYWYCVWWSLKFGLSIHSVSATEAKTMQKLLKLDKIFPVSSGKQFENVKSSRVPRHRKTALMNPLAFFDVIDRVVTCKLICQATNSESHDCNPVKISTI